MQRTRIKVCCIASPAELDLAVAAGADAIGLVGAMPSGPGPIADPLIAAIAATVPPPVTAVLLTSETRAADIAAHATRTGVGTVQIVSEIDPAELRSLARLLPRLRRVQVIHVDGPGALARSDRYAALVDAFLLDSGRPNAAVPTLGGTGDVHDWAVSAAFVARSPRPVFLAGGLDAANVGAAIARVRPFGVDVCSGLRSGGNLDPARLAAFVAAVAIADRRG